MTEELYLHILVVRTGVCELKISIIRDVTLFMDGMGYDRNDLLLYSRYIKDITRY